MDIKQMRQSTLSDLEKKLNELFDEQFRLRMQHGVESVKKTHLFKQKRRAIARIKTIITEKCSEGVNND